MRRRIVVSTLAILLLVTVSSMASTIITFGPFPDFAGYVDVTASVTLNTSVTFRIPFDGTIRITDKITVSVTKRIPIYVPTYVRIKVDILYNIISPLSFFDIYALDLNPDLPGTSLTGFNPQDPELVPLTDETFIGISGTEYPAPIQTVTLGELPSLVPDFDLSAFGGDPASIVYLAGPGNVPFDDVPEPCTIGLLMLGTIPMLLRRK